MNKTTTTQEGGNHMAAEKKEKTMQTSQTEDVRECMELMKNLTEGQKERVIGIMMGMQMRSEQMAVQSA